jgi:hypothetical protein
MLLALATSVPPAQAQPSTPLALQPSRFTLYSSPLTPHPAPSWPDVPPIASYSIAVALDPDAHTLVGREVVTYHNRTADTIPNLVWHLYLNAFRSEDTIFMRESGGQLRGFGYDPAHLGWIEVGTLTLQRPGGDTVDLLPASVVSETLLTTPLPEALAPGGVLTLTVDFRAQLPQVFARTGFFDDYNMVGQWFPKLGVYQQDKGWNAVQFHANSEFFADFGTYDLAVTVPAGYLVGAVGVPSGQTNNSDGTVTFYYHAEAVIDTAWAACPRFREAHRTAGPAEIVLFYLPEHEALATRYLAAAEKALAGYGEWFAPYPYPRLTLIDVPDQAPGAGGMEYPTLVTVGSLGLSLPPGLGTDLFPELVTVHEVGHQWWQSTVATNEGAEPWLDEGLTEYSAARLLEWAYPGQALEQVAGFRITSWDLDRMEYLVSPGVPMYGAAWTFDGTAYAVAAYYKPAMVLASMERIVGAERWLQVMRTYCQRYRFGHPTTEDFLNVVAEEAGPAARQLLEPLVYKAGTLDYAVAGLQCAPSGQLYRCEATVTRQGAAVLPVEVEFTFAGGQQERQTWDGQDGDRTFTFEQAVPVDSVQLDPDRKLLLDRDWLNNSLSRPVQAVPIVRMLSSWLYDIEQLVLTLGGLW